MLYKTIILQFLEKQPELHSQLRRNRTLLPTLERLASELKASHEALMDSLSQAKPGSAQTQIASEALEIALKGLESRLSSESHQEDSDALSLDGAMAFYPSHAARVDSSRAAKPRSLFDRIPDRDEPEAPAAAAIRRPSPPFSGPAWGHKRRHVNQPAGHCKQERGPRPITRWQ